MPIEISVNTEQLKSLRSFDHPCLVGELSRTLYIDSLHNEIFDQLTDDILQNGIMTPLRVVNRHLVDGHHRAIIALELDLPEIPISYEGTLPPPLET